MKHFLRKLRLWLFPPVGRRKALLIASRAYVPDHKKLCISDRMPKNANIYDPHNLHDEPFWYIIGPWNDGQDGKMLRSSRMIIVSKTTGQVLFDGPANDEG